MNFKYSKYNIPVGISEVNGVPKGIYNTSSGNYIALTKEQQSTFSALAEGNIDFNNKTKELFESGILIDARIDELKTIWHAFNSARTYKKAPQLTIAPTMNCNFGCYYCFEDHEKGVMSEKVQDGLIDFIEHSILSKDQKFLSVTWFGGEPLMGMKAIRRITDHIFRLKDQGRIEEYQCDMITNGFQLNKKLAKELIELGVSKLQITLDGPKFIHDQRRTLKGKGGETYDKIVSNILDLPDGIDIVIRINVDKGNASHVDTLLRDLQELKIFDRAHVSVAKVEDFQGHKELPSSFMTSMEYATFESDLKSKAIANGWPLHINSLSPSIAGVCQVDSVNSFVVDNKGELMKCWAELGNKGHIVGNVTNPKEWSTVKSTVLTERDPFDDAECLECQLLPTCMGSCPIIRNNNKINGVKTCPPFKYNYPSLLETQFGSESKIIKLFNLPKDQPGIKD